MSENPFREKLSPKSATQMEKKSFVPNGAENYKNKKKKKNENDMMQRQPSAAALAAGKQSSSSSALLLPTPTGKSSTLLRKPVAPTATITTSNKPKSPTTSPTKDSTANKQPHFVLSDQHPTTVFTRGRAALRDSFRLGKTAATTPGRLPKSTDATGNGGGSLYVKRVPSASRVLQQSAASTAPVVKARVRRRESDRGIGAGGGAPVLLGSLAQHDSEPSLQRYSSLREPYHEPTPDYPSSSEASLDDAQLSPLRRHSLPDIYHDAEFELAYELDRQQRPHADSTDSHHRDSRSDSDPQYLFDDLPPKAAASVSHYIPVVKSVVVVDDAAAGASSKPVDHKEASPDRDSGLNSPTSEDSDGAGEHSTSPPLFVPARVGVDEAAVKFRTTQLEFSGGQDTGGGMELDHGYYESDDEVSTLPPSVEQRPGDRLGEGGLVEPLADYPRPKTLSFADEHGLQLELVHNYFHDNYNPSVGEYDLQNDQNWLSKRHHRQQQQQAAAAGRHHSRSSSSASVSKDDPVQSAPSAFSLSKLMELGHKPSRHSAPYNASRFVDLGHV